MSELVKQFPEITLSFSSCVQVEVPEGRSRAPALIHLCGEGTSDPRGRFGDGARPSLTMPPVFWYKVQSGLESHQVPHYLRQSTGKKSGMNERAGDSKLTDLDLFSFLDVDVDVGGVTAVDILIHFLLKNCRM